MFHQTERRSLGDQSVELSISCQMGWGLVRSLQLSQIGSSWMTIIAWHSQVLERILHLFMPMLLGGLGGSSNLFDAMEKSWPNCTHHHRPVSDMLFHRFLRDLLLHMACLNHLLGGSFQGRTWGHDAMTSCLQMDFAALLKGEASSANVSQKWRVHSNYMGVSPSMFKCGKQASRPSWRP